MLHEDRTIELARGYEELKKLYLPNGMDPRQPIDFDGMRKKVPGRASPQFKRRKSLEFKWARALQGAKSVTFVNEVNYEEVPSLVENFKYLERGYVRAPDVPSNVEVADCLVSCECDDRCDDAAECGCQGPSELVNSSGERIFAYTQRGLFNFALLPGMEAIECNDSCSCDETCPNRVAQRPRDVAIEVFRTRNCGWGARATVALPPGKVLGIYTGSVFPPAITRREEADTYEGERKSYIFDLDVREGADDDDEADKYSVDGYAHGNWTRFVNHSCEPNLRVYPVVWDTIPELNQPYLAFVAMKNIPPRTELTIDYDPKAAEEARRSKGKHRQRTPEGARHCMCGSANCRGWVRV
ncbi:SET domain-containing protein [Lentinus tigrinus ALCF2SS1-7]|uniref:SET domain-containing protein n=1 Tax=Lentinus tigrinus ALCF2SS1-7 TaxID=1328758 RepID=UPI001165E253|nr:SET domain-containing protein [Lentinus tigrinus ALCF2SS1-7]